MKAYLVRDLARRTGRTISAWWLVAMCTSGPLVAAVGKDGGASGAFSYARDSDVAILQSQVKNVVERYQRALNGSDFSTMRKLFAPDAVAEWNEKATVVGIDAMKAPYETLFKQTKFTTDFQYDAVDLYGETAIVRTHHPIGQTELSLKDGSRKLDMNRELFVLRRFGSEWKIVLYTFTTQPRQGEQ